MVTKSKTKKTIEKGENIRGRWSETLNISPQSITRPVMALEALLCDPSNSSINYHFRRIKKNIEIFQNLTLNNPVLHKFGP
jgi:hypothetical protein